MAKGYGGQMNPRSGGNMMAQLAKLQQQMEEVQDSLAAERVTESAGGGGVSVTVSGDQRVLGVQIAPDLLVPGEAEMVQDLLITAMNKALESAKRLSEEKMAPFTNMLSGLGMGR